MKIIQAVGWYFPDSLGGTEVYVRALCHRLQAAGHEVVVAAPDPGASGERRYEDRGVRVYRYPIAKDVTRAEARGEVAVRGAERFHRWLMDERAGVVHFHTFVTGMSLPELRAARRSGARTIVTTHSSSLGFLCMRGTLMHWGEQPCDGIVEPSKCVACALHGRGVPKPVARAFGEVPLPFARAVRNAPTPLATALALPDVVRANLARQREALSIADRFVVLTEAAQAILRANAFDAANVSVNRLGIAQAVTRKSPPRERPTVRPVRIGYIGRFESIKGAEVLARAIALTGRDVPLRVEFRGPVNTAADRAAVERIRALTSGDARVSIAPAVPPEQIADVLADLDVLCCPAVCHEGGPTVALEALAVGTPVIGSRIGGLAEMIRDDVNGRLVPAGDASSLASALTDVASSPDTTIDRWRASISNVRTMDDVAADYLTYYVA